MTTLTFTVDPDEMDALVAQQLRACYESLAQPFGDWPERIATMEAILVVLEHYMAEKEYNEWYETIKEL